MEPDIDLSEYAGWFADLANQEILHHDLRALLVSKIPPEGVDQAVREVENTRRIRTLLAKLRWLEIDVSADFEERLMAQVRSDATLLNLLEVYLTGFGQALIELINALFSFFPEPPTSEFSTV